jgi:PBSX family phage portal protein
MAGSDAEVKAPQELNVNVRNYPRTEKAQKASEGEFVSRVQDSEDEFKAFYKMTSGRGSAIQPPFDPGRLQRFEMESNALSPCVDAMETNIDGTGHVIELASGESPSSEDEKKIEEAEAFFDEPWPGMSFITMRRKLRRDMERCGYGFLEALRNAKGELVFLRYVEAKTVRLVELDEAVPRKVSITRSGREFDATVHMRDRRFAQVVNSKLVYFKEFGTERDLDKDTGHWAPKGNGISAQKRATELLYFTVKRDLNTPYGVPRWISQLPSVIGSRKAEEHNLEFFDRGGIPPILVLVQGGSIAEKSSEALDSVLNSSSNTLNAAVVEVFGGGTVDKDSPVKVTVERFGAERQNDSMFESYDEKSELRIRSSFRLPPLFVGKSADYSFATAFASYTVAEAQVFQPERTEFDEIINIKVMPALGYEGLVFRSLPLSVKDVQHQLKAIEMAATNKVISGEDLVESLNEATNTALKYDEEGQKEEEPPPIIPVNPAANATQGEQGADPGAPGAIPPGANGTPVEPPTAKSEDEDKIVPLVSKVANQIFKGRENRDEEEWASLMKEVLSLDDYGRNLFDRLLAVETFGDISLDPNGAAELSGCALAIMAATMFEDDGPVH